MSYYKLKHICNNYNEPSTALTCNKKYISPFLKDSQKIAVYENNNCDVNSYEYLNNNLYSQTKSYNTIVNSYENYVTKLLNKRDELLKKEEKLLKKEEEELKKINNTTNTPIYTTTPTIT